MSPPRRARPAPSQPELTFGGAVLVGGDSSRMGRNKALLRVEGRALWQRQCRVLRAAGARPVRLVQARGQAALRPRGVWRDTAPGVGPLAGLHAALVACPHPWLAVLAVDMPAIDAGWFRRLAARCEEGRSIVVRGPWGWEPLAAIYPRAALAEVGARLARGEGSLQACVAALIRQRRLAGLRASARDRAQLVNWNTPADLALGGLVPLPGIEPGSHV